ncbi:hypothetical protein Ari01nite_95730 [Paractinoplanes rishiriensis]|uniref:Non-specific serine/threonine protein kinase n=1 Tax=Paractinoplanes rishiriensis TaxID=1050105 RepID=A0A919KBH5_9ACTN|nr:hypothetical protein Ari01nite_95730 [Actinoplanes rishiriensis]
MPPDAFEVLGEIGRGAEAVVHRVRRDGTEYAMKLLQPSTAAHDEVLRRLHRTVALLAAARHPSLVRVHEVGVHDGRPYVLLDLVEGRRLTDVLAGGPLPDADLIRVGLGLAGALTAVHGCGLVHRDVKPDNVLLEADGSPRLIDFGLAERVAGETGDQVAGTLAYTAPERTGMLHRQADGRADLYSLGVLLYECATGSAPYSSSDVGELLRLHAVAPVPDPRDAAPALSPALAGIIRKLLAKDPDDRYQSGTGLLADLEAARTQPDFALGTADEPVVAADVPFVGRDRELAALTELRQRGGFVQVRGAAGSGRTRLVQEFTAAVARDGHLVLNARCARDRTQPLTVLRAAIDAHLRAVKTLPAALARVREAAGEAAPLVQTLSTGLAEVLAAGEQVSDVSQGAYLSVLAEFLGALATRSGGAVLTVDDVQWCDEATLRVLQLIAPGAPLLVVAIARDDTDVPGVTATVDVEPLDAAGTAALVAATNGGLSISDEVAARLAARSHGNPFTLLAYVTAVVDAGLVRVHPGGWSVDVAGLDALELPTGVAELVLNRVAALDPVSRRVLGLAAVAGHRFAAGLVAELSGDDRHAVLGVLRDGTREGLVEVREDGTYAFPHDRIRQALIDQFDEATRRHLHDDVADLLDRYPDRDADTVYALAQHRIDGSPGYAPADLVRSCHAAGELALAEYAPEAAVYYLEHAAVMAQRGGIRTGHAFHELLGRAYHQAARLDEAAATLRVAVASATDPLQRAHSLHLLGRVHESAFDTVSQIRAADEALAELGRSLPRNPVLRVLSSIGCLFAGLLVWLTRVGYGRARGRARERDVLVCSLFEDLGSAYLRDLRPRESVVYALRAPLPASRIGLTPESVSTLNAISFLCETLRMHRLADRLWTAADRGAAALGDPALAARASWRRGIARHNNGIDSGETLREVLDRQDRWLNFGFLLDAHSVLAWDWLLHGDMFELRAEIAASRQRADAHGQSDRSSVVTTEACLLALQGREVEAAAHLLQLDGLQSLQHYQVDVLIARVRGALERGDLGEAYEQAVGEFDALGLSPLDVLPAQHGFYVIRAYAELERLRTATEEARGARLAAAKAAVAVVGKVTRRPLMAAHRHVVEAALADLSGDPAQALAKLAAAAPVLRTVDAPLVAFEAAVVAARALRALRVPGQALREARTALAIAEEQGWPQRARRVVAEFGLNPAVPASATTTAGDSWHGQRWAALQQVSLAASRVLDPARLARIALDETIRILGAERAYLLLEDEAVAGLGRFVGRDAGGNELTELAGYSASLVERIRADRRAVVVTGTQEGEAPGSRSMVAYGLRSILVAPLLLDDRLLGVVYLDSRVAKGMFTAADVDTLTAITHHVAVSLETARTAQLELAVTAANRQRDLAETLRQAMAWFTDTLEPDVVLGRAFTSLRRGGVEGHAYVVLGESGEQSVVVKHLHGEEVRREPVDVDPADLHTAADAEAAAHLLGLPEPAASWLVVPLIARGVRRGVLLVASARPEAYGETDLEIVAALAGQAMAAYDNALLFAQVNEHARIDALTGIANRRHFFDLAGGELADAHRYQNRLAAVMLDIDHFKKINDTYGHQAGDEVIREVVRRLAATGRPGDLLARYGGEEFVLLLPDVGDDAAAIAERLRADVAAGPVGTAAGDVPVTISIGVAHLDPAERIDALLARADACLYQAKTSGRNRVVLT